MPRPRRSRPRRRQLSLPFAKTQPLRTDRPAHPQGPAASSPPRHGRRRFRRRRLRTPSAPKPQIPPRTGPRRRRRSSGGFGLATPTERPANRSPSLGCRGPAAPACRPVPAPVPRGRGATCSSASPVSDGFDLPAGPCSPRAVAVVRACIRSRPALPARWVFTGSPPSPSGPRRLPSGNPRAARSRPRTRGTASSASAARGRSPCLAAHRALAPPSLGAHGRDRPARPVRPFRSHPSPQRSEPRPVPRPVNERRPAVKHGRRVEPGVTAGATDACGRCLTTERRSARRAVDQAHRPPRRAAAPGLQAPAGPCSPLADIREHPERRIAPGPEPLLEPLASDRPAASLLLRPHRSLYARPPCKAGGGVAPPQPRVRPFPAAEPQPLRGRLLGREPVLRLLPVPGFALDPALQSLSARVVHAAARRVHRDPRPGGVPSLM